MGSINNNLTSNYLQSVISGALQTTGISNQNTQSLLNGITGAGVNAPADNGQLSPFAQIVSELQQLQQSNPTQYQQVTQQIATNLQSAAQSAQAAGNTTAANQLTQLSTDFSNASSSGQLPNLQDLAQAVGGHHHHHHHGGGAQGTGSSDANSGTSSTTGASGSSGTSSSAAQLFASWFANNNQNSALDPTSIILNTLSSAGVTGA